MWTGLVSHTENSSVSFQNYPAHTHTHTRRDICPSSSCTPQRIAQQHRFSPQVCSSAHPITSVSTGISATVFNVLEELSTHVLQDREGCYGSHICTLWLGSRKTAWEQALPLQTAFNFFNFSAGRLPVRHAAPHTDTLSGYHCQPVRIVCHFGGQCVVGNALRSTPLTSAS